MRTINPHTINGGEKLERPGSHRVGCSVIHFGGFDFVPFCRHGSDWYSTEMAGSRYHRCGDSKCRSIRWFCCTSVIRTPWFQFNPLQLLNVRIIKRFGSDCPLSGSPLDLYNRSWSRVKHTSRSRQSQKRPLCECQGRVQATSEGSEKEEPESVQMQKRVPNLGACRPASIPPWGERPRSDSRRTRETSSKVRIITAFALSYKWLRRASCRKEARQGSWETSRKTNKQ